MNSRHSVNNNWKVPKVDRNNRSSDSNTQSVSDNNSNCNTNSGSINIRLITIEIVTQVVKVIVIVLVIVVAKLGQGLIKRECGVVTKVIVKLMATVPLVLLIVLKVKAKV